MMAQMTGVVITVRFRGHFRDLVGCESVMIRFEPGDFAGEGPTLESLWERLGQLLPDADARETIKQAVAFHDGRLLCADDRVGDGAIVHILPPLAGGIS